MTEIEQIVAAYLRGLAATARDEQSRGCYLHAAEGIERGDHRKGERT